MDNPWKEISLSDYEGHMALPQVKQASMLSNEFKQVLTAQRPRSVAVVGCAGGNGFDEARQSGVERLVGIDINCDYVGEAKARYEGAFSELELACIDIQSDFPAIRPVDMIYAALIFEYVNIEKTLSNLRSICKHGGLLVVVLQLPKVGLPPVSSSPYTSLNKLTSLMRLIPPNEMTDIAQTTGFSLISTRTITLESGKEFALQLYTLSS